MKKLITISVMMLTMVSIAQNAKWTGKKTFSPTLKFVGLPYNDLNTEFISLDEEGTPSITEINLSTPPIQKVLQEGNVTDQEIRFQYPSTPEYFVESGKNGFSGRTAIGGDRDVSFYLNSAYGLYLISNTSAHGSAVYLEDQIRFYQPGGSYQTTLLPPVNMRGNKSFALPSVGGTDWANYTIPYKINGQVAGEDGEINIASPTPTLQRALEGGDSALLNEGEIILLGTDKGSPVSKILYEYPEGETQFRIQPGQIFLHSNENALSASLSVGNGFFQVTSYDTRLQFTPSVSHALTDIFIPAKTLPGTYTIATLDDIPNMVENPTADSLTTSNLNNTYPNAIPGFKVYAPTENFMYEKVPSGWVKYGSNPVD